MNEGKINTIHRTEELSEVLDLNSIKHYVLMCMHVFFPFQEIVHRIKFFCRINKVFVFRVHPNKFSISSYSFDSSYYILTMYTIAPSSYALIHTQWIKINFSRTFIYLYSKKISLEVECFNLLYARIYFIGTIQALNLFESSKFYLILNFFFLSVWL